MTNDKGWTRLLTFDVSDRMNDRASMVSSRPICCISSARDSVLGMQLTVRAQSVLDSLSKDDGTDTLA